MKLAILIAALGFAGLASSGCWCACEAHGTTLPLPQAQCGEPSPSRPTREPGPSSQPQNEGKRPVEPGPASQPSR